MTKSLAHLTSATLLPRGQREEVRAVRPSGSPVVAAALLGCEHLLMDQGSAKPPQDSPGASLSMREVMFLIVLLVAGLGLYQLRDDWYPIYQYHLGAPTTAVIDYCERGMKGVVVCSGTWTVDGQSQSGFIEGADRFLTPGSSLAVHVNEGKAYTARAVGMSIFYIVFFGSLVIGLCALMIRAMRRLRTSG
jgi:hypothetical protein